MKGHLVRFRAAVLVAGVLLLSGGCSSFTETTPPIIDLEDVVFDPSLGVDLSQMTRLPSGLYYQDLVVGAGDVAVRWLEVAIHYRGWLNDGTQFVSSYDEGEPFVFIIGDPQGAIRGLDEGVQGMRVGGKRKLAIPPHLAYGEAGVGPIPGNTPVVFEVELVEILG